MVQASDDAGLYKKGDRLIACSGAWPATSRLTVDFYFTYYMKRYKYALHIEKGSFWTEDSEGIPWSYAFPESRSSSLSCRITMQALFLRSGKIGVPSKTDGSEVRPGRTRQSAGLPMLGDRRSGFLPFRATRKRKRGGGPPPPGVSFRLCANPSARIRGSRSAWR